MKLSHARAWKRKNSGERTPLLHEARGSHSRLHSTCLQRHMEQIPHVPFRQATEHFPDLSWAEHSLHWRRSNKRSFFRVKTMSLASSRLPSLPTNPLNFRFRMSVDNSLKAIVYWFVVSQLSFTVQRSDTVFESFRIGWCRTPRRWRYAKLDDA